MQQQEPNPHAFAAYCTNCTVREPWPVRQRGVFRRLCTACILRLHPQSFCPICFLVYEHSPPPDSITCFKCSSASSESNEGRFVVDHREARKLLAAAKIVASSMTKAAAEAAAEAERRAQKAALAKKWAREALDHAASLAAKEKLKKELLASPSVFQGSGEIMNKQGNNHCTNNNKFVKNHGEGNRVDRSGEVLAASNAMEFSEKEKVQQRFKIQNVGLRYPINGVVAMHMHDNNKSSSNGIAQDEKTHSHGGEGSSGSKQ